MIRDCCFGRYFKYELYPKKAIAKAALPPFLSTWLELKSPDCMFSASQEKNWPTGHLQSGAWYLECSDAFIPPQELSLFESIKDSPILVLETDDFAGLDADAREKALKKRERSEMKKVEKWESTKKKTEENKAKKEARDAEKAQAEKTKSEQKGKGKKRKAETAATEPATSDGALKDTSSSASLTQEKLKHGLPPEVHDLQALPNVDQCILNGSISSLLADDGGPLPDAFKEMVSMLDKVTHLWFLFFIDSI